MTDAQENTQHDAARRNRKVLKWIFLTWLTVVAVALAVRLSTEGPAKVRASLAESKYSDWFVHELETQVEDMRKLGVLIRVEPSMNQAYVNALIWAGINIDAKTGVAKKLAQYCEIKGKTQRVRILDYQSGRELATFSETWGLEIK